MQREATSHKQILKSTGILGGAQVIEMLIRVVRSKIVAVLLGPLGVGVIGLYQSIIDLIKSATGFGINFSAVRDIAEAAGSEDEKRISRAGLILRRWVWFTGLFGMVLTFVFCKSLSRFTFGNEQYARGIAVLSMVLLLLSLSGGQLALLQGLRKIGLMAKAKVFGLIVGFCITVPLYWFFRLHGIVPALLITAVISLLFSWFYARKIHIPSIPLTLRETFRGGVGMVRLGFFMVIGSFAMVATMYLVRAFISRKGGIDSVGQFQAAWNLSNIYLAAVLQAMAGDYFPRLSAAHQDNGKVVQLANEQTEVALLIAGPIVVGMLSLVSLVVTLLYSAQFIETVRILHWQLAGTFLKVISWPIGFIILAKGRGGTFICTELSWNIGYFSIVYFGWNTFELEITGLAFLISFLIYSAILFAITYRMCGFRWSSESLKHISVFSALLVFAFIISKYITGAKGYLAGGFLSLVGMAYSYHRIRGIVNLRTLLKSLRKR